MLLASSAGVLDTTQAQPFVVRNCAGKRLPEPEAIGGSTRCLVAPATGDSERILAEFGSLYVGPAHGIDKVVLEAAEGGGQRIVAYVYDWNGIINIPAVYQGMKVSFTQHVPIGATWQL